MALLGPTGWKVARLVVYRDAAIAHEAMAERLAALHDCKRHDEGGGIATVWWLQPLAIGEEAMSVGSHRYRGDQVARGGSRGAVMRQGRP